MFGVTRHVRVIVATVTAFGAIVPLRAFAATAPSIMVANEPKIIVTEVQSSASTASEEFIELYNLTDHDTDLADPAEPWKLQFFSSTATMSGQPDWSKPTSSLALTGTIGAHGYFLLTSASYAPAGIPGDQPYSAKLSDAGGGLQVVQSTASATMVHDRLIWQRVTTGQALPAGVFPAPPSSGSLQRTPTDADTYVNADGILTAFTSDTVISPLDIWHAPISAPTAGGSGPISPDSGADGASSPMPSTDPTSGGSVSDVTGASGNGPSAPADSGGAPSDAPGTVTSPPSPIAPVANSGLAVPMITELLPNPASPLKDETDEFIELYNPNDAAFDLKGYTIQVGTTTLHEYTILDSMLVAPNSFTVFYSRETGLSLTNTGGQVKLLDPSGGAIASSEPYPAAPDGQAWTYDGAGWVWSTTATPGTANTISSPAVQSRITAPKPVTLSTSTKTAKTTSVSKVSTPRSNSAKTSSKSSTKATATTKAKPKAATAKAKTAKTKLSAAAANLTIPDRAPIHSMVLVAVAVLAVLYAAYEYRHDLRNLLLRLKRDRSVRAYAR